MKHKGIVITGIILLFGGLAILWGQYNSVYTKPANNHENELTDISDDINIQIPNATNTTLLHSKKVSPDKNISNINTDNMAFTDEVTPENFLSFMTNLDLSNFSSQKIIDTLKAKGFEFNTKQTPTTLAGGKQFRVVSTSTKPLLGINLIKLSYVKETNGSEFLQNFSYEVPNNENIFNTLLHRANAENKLIPKQNDSMHIFTTPDKYIIWIDTKNSLNDYSDNATKDVAVVTLEFPME